LHFGHTEIHSWATSCRPSLAEKGLKDWASGSAGRLAEEKSSLPIFKLK
jgi:hypothetical protein